MKDRSELFKDLLRASGPDSERAFKVLMGPIPAQYVTTRTARGGNLKYVAHEVVTDLMTKAFGCYWSWDIQDTGFSRQERADKQTGELKTYETAWARGTLTLYVKVGDRVLPRTTTEIGMFDNAWLLTDAAARSSAASRVLCRTVARAIGFGMELYGEVADATMRPLQAWRCLLDYAVDRDVTEGAMIAALQEAEIDSKVLGKPDVFRKAWQAVTDLGEEVQPEKEPLPEPEYTEDVDVTQAADAVGDAVFPSEPVKLDVFGDVPAEVPGPVQRAAQELGASIRDEYPAETPTIANWGQFYGHVCTAYPVFTSGSQVLNVIDRALKPAEKKSLSASNQWGEIETKLLEQHAKDEAAKEAAKQK